MNIVTTGLIADGTSDRALIPLLKLLLQAHLTVPFEEPQFIQCDLQELPSKVQQAVNQFSLDVLFVHRDAESQPWEQREKEIRAAASGDAHTHVVSVIPVKMTEAWLLTDEVAIRSAVGNPNSTVALNLPKTTNLEGCAAKDVLFCALTAACDLGNRRRRKFRPEKYRHRVAELTNDLTALRKIPSFKRFEDSLVVVLGKLSNP